MMAANPRREPLARLSLQSNNANRMSLSGAAGPLKPNLEARPSLAGKRESLLGGGRPSLPSHSRQSLGGGGSALSRQSIAPAGQNRLSLGGNPPANRRLSTSVVPASKIADPRPLGQKMFTADCVKKILTHLTVHKYDASFTAKSLQSPSKAGFQHMLSFLMREFDRNFEFGNLEDEFRFYMKQFGYPGTLRKDAFVPVGSPHTWPSVLAAVAWLVDYLDYMHVIRDFKAQKSDELFRDEQAPEPELNLFEYNVRSYRKFMNGDDGASSHKDEDLVRAYGEKNQQLSQQLVKLQAKVDALKSAKVKLNNPEGTVKHLDGVRDTLKADVEKFKAFAAQCRTHKEQLAAQLIKTRQEAADQAQLLEASEEERVLLEATLAKQKFTPLEVQEMNHQRDALKQTLDALEAQKTSVQQEIWAQEKTNGDEQFQLEARTKAFNECAKSLELTPCTALYAKGVDYQLKFNAQAKEASNLVGVDLTRALKPVLFGLKKQLTSEMAIAQSKLREAGSQVAGLVEQKEAQIKQVRSLEERLHRYDEVIRQEKEGSEKEISALLAKTEAVELEISQLKGSQSRILDESETRIHQLDHELVEQRQSQMAARDKLVRQMRDTSDRVLEHKSKITKLLEEARQGVAAARNAVERGPAQRLHATPGKTRVDFEGK